LITESKEHNEESIRLLANEIMHHSKGFLVFAVMEDGSLRKCGDTTGLKAAELWGLDFYCRKEGAFF
jgi:hypothetical protein